MIAYPDTSFLFAIYVNQSSSPAAAAHAAIMQEPLHVTALLEYEFRQGLRFQAWRHSANMGEGIAPPDVQTALKRFEADLNGGVTLRMPCDFPEVCRRAEELSTRHTMVNGHRSFDILHVATALHLGAQEFLTFDRNQRKLAAAEKLKVNRLL